MSQVAPHCLQHTHLLTVYNFACCAGKPLVLPKTPSLSACYNRNFTLYCDVSPIHILQFRGIYWIFNSHRILGGFDTYAVSSNGRELVIHNVTASTAGDYGCGIELNCGTLVEGDTYSMYPLGMYVRNMYCK